VSVIVVELRTTHGTKIRRNVNSFCVVEIIVVSVIVVVSGEWKRCGRRTVTV
jgi:hypothetical protein